MRDACCAECETRVQAANHGRSSPTALAAVWNCGARGSDTRCLKPQDAAKVQTNNITVHLRPLFATDLLPAARARVVLLRAQRQRR